MNKRKIEQPKIIAPNKSNNKIRESGCCFRSCGGVPLLQRDRINIKRSKIKNRLLRIKE